jgi:hypothetical protein
MLRRDKTTASAHMEDLRRGLHGGGASNAALPGFGSLRGEDEEVEELHAKLLARRSGEWCGDGGTRESAELAVAMVSPGRSRK